MINNLSDYFIKQFFGDSIDSNEFELYKYGSFIFFSHAFYLIVTVLFAFLFGCVLESIIFYIAFQFIRRYAGGYHASTETRCEIMSTLSILVCVVLIRLSNTYSYQSVLLLLTFFAAVCIFLVCPLDTPEKPLSEEEFKQFRRISRIILFVITIITFFSAAFKITFLLYPTCLSLILESILLIAGKIKQSKLKGKDDREESLRSISP